MAEKPIDDLNDRNPRSWKRGMLQTGITSRFGISASDLNESSNARSALYQIPTCPECGGSMFARGVTLSDGKRMYVPQCVMRPRDSKHSFDKWSPHGTRGPMGRKVGSQNKVKKEAPREERKIEVEIKKEEIIVKPQEKISVIVSGKVVHPEIVRASKYVMAGERNIYLTGPAGTGKSTGAEHLHEILKSQDQWKESTLHMLTVSLSTFVSDLAGFLDRLNKGEFVMTDLVKALQAPGVVVVDEADKGNPNLAGFWNVILANAQVNTPGGVFKRHPDNVVVFIGNTTGHQPNKQYSGSVRQDYATLDRFRCFNVGFVEAVERAAIPGLNESLYSRMRQMRTQANSTGLQRILGTRWLKRVNQAMAVEGINDPSAAIKKVMQDESWSNDEIIAAGI